MYSKASKSRRLLGLLGLAAVCARGETLQDLGELEKLAQSQAQRLLPPLSDRQRMVIGPLQSGLKLARCEGPVRAARAPGIAVQGRALIELRCDSGASWHIYVPVKVIGTTPVVLAAHAIVAGTVLGPNDLTVEQRDLTGLPPGYLDAPDIALGLTAARAIAGGSVLTNQQLLGVQAVQRGQMVTLLAESDGVSIKMAGRALNDGFVNQRVKVENLSSGKVVEGIARSAQVVEINF
jgi:flagella basal body P-ring formation protein FlgA